jgi:hypothetical protein
LQFEAGKRYRLRLITITGDLPVSLSLSDGTTPIQWRALARGRHDLARVAVDDETRAHDSRPGRFTTSSLCHGPAGTLTLQYGIPAFAARARIQADRCGVRVK